MINKIKDVNWPLTADASAVRIFLILFREALQFTKAFINIVCFDFSLFSAHFFLMEAEHFFLMILSIRYQKTTRKRGK